MTGVVHRNDPLRRALIPGAQNLPRSPPSAPLAMQDAKSAEEEEGDILWGNSYQPTGNKS